MIGPRAAQGIGLRGQEPEDPGKIARSFSWKDARGFLILASVFLAVTAGLFAIGPDTIVAAIGVEGGYLLVFASGLVGVSALTSGPFYAAVGALASTGEFHPLALGLAAAPAMAVGHTLFYFLGRNGRTFLDPERLERLSEWIRRRPAWVPPAVAYVYSGFTPLPQDALMAALGFTGVPFLRVLPAVFLGNITLIALLSWLVQNGFAAFS